MDGEDDHAASHNKADVGVPVHHHLLFLVVVRDSDLPIIVPSGEADDDGEDAGEGVEEVEDCKEEDTAGSLEASSANSQQS